MNRSKMRLSLCYVTVFVASAFLATSTIATAFLIQPYNYMLDDSSILTNSQSHNQQQDSDDNLADRDFVGLLSDSINRLKAGRMIQEQQQQAADEANANNAHLSQEMADLINEKQQSGESAADILLNVAQAAAEHVSQQQSEQQQQTNNDNNAMASRGSILELDTSRQQVPSKSDLKETNQWYNPKEIIPALKISAMGKF